MAFCARCGVQHAFGASFCGQCGLPVPPETWSGVQNPATANTVGQPPIDDPSSSGTLGDDISYYGRKFIKELKERYENEDVDADPEGIDVAAVENLEGDEYEEDFDDDIEDCSDDDDDDDDDEEGGLFGFIGSLLDD